MIGYFDTSAVVPLVIAEPGSQRCADLWRACDIRVSSMLVIAEAHAALALALRVGRLTADGHTSSAASLSRRLNELSLAVPTRSVVESAARLALSHALRGYDAIHAATAMMLQSPDLVVVSGDQALLAAVANLGMAIADTVPFPRDSSS